MTEQRLRRSAPKSAGREAKVVDRVFMHDLVLDVEIGVYTHEKGVTQRVRCSVDVDLFPAVHTLNDDIRQHNFGDFLKRTLLAEVRLGF